MFKTLDDIVCSGTSVIVRGDLNVPIHNGVITDTTRIENLAITIKELCAKGARVIVISHLGRPKGKVNPNLSLRPIIFALSTALDGIPVNFVDDCIGGACSSEIKKLPDGGVILLENLRFYSGEEANDPTFSASLSANGEIFVNDAFSVSHRTHASITGIPQHLPAYAGRGMEKELEALKVALDAPRHPVAAIVGGSKISTKLSVLGHLIRKVNLLIIGGGMANTFLCAAGYGVGQSICEEPLIDIAREIKQRADERGCQIILPRDVVVGVALRPGVKTQTVSVDSVPFDSMILDIGSRSAATIIEHLHSCETLLWNGPLGAFEVKPFDRGTNTVSNFVARQTQTGCLVSIAGGGDTVSALSHASVIKDFSYVSTAGGAFLEWLEGKELPGIAALTS